MLSVEIYRAYEAQCHFNPDDPRSLAVQDYLGGLVTQVGLAERELLQRVEPGLRIIKNVEGVVERVELVVPVEATSADEARHYLRPDRPPDKRGRPRKQRQQPPGLPTARAKACPKFNPYHLVAVLTDERGATSLRFILRQAYRYVAEAGKNKGQTVTAYADIEGLHLQGVLVRWLRTPRLAALPPSLKSGAAQEVAQMLASHIGLIEEGSQASVGLPDLDHCDQELIDRRYAEALERLSGQTEPLVMKPLRQVLRGRFAADDPRGDELVPTDQLWRLAAKPPKLKRQPLRFTQSGQLVTYRRLWWEHGRRRVGLYVALPLGSEEGIPEHFLWWQTRLDEFTPLPAWPDASLVTPKRAEPKRLLMIPLSVQGGQRRLRRQAKDLGSSEHGRFVQALNGKNWQPCWSLLVERDSRYYFQIIVKREVVPMPRPNLLGVYASLEGDEVDGWSTRLYWHCRAGAGQTPSLDRQGMLRVDCLPPNRDYWPGRKQRRTLGYDAAGQLVRLAQELNAELAIGEPSALKKRGQGSLLNALATRTNYSDLAKFITDKALVQNPPIRVFSVSGALLRDDREKPPEEQARRVATEGQKIRAKVDRL